MKRKNNNDKSHGEKVLLDKMGEVADDKGSVIKVLEIVICDTDKDFSGVLSEMLKTFYESRGCRTEIRLFSDGNIFADTLIDGEPIDILFLNTKLGNISGFAVAELVRLSEKKQCKIIFLCENGEDVFQTFFYQPTWCVRKQFLGEELEKALKQMWKFDHRERSMLVHEGRSVCYVRIDKILYLVSDGHYVCIKCFEQNYRVRSSMSYFEKILENNYFVHPSKKYLINCAHVESLSDKVVMKDGSVIECSRGKKSEVKRILERYMNEMEHCL